MTTMNLTPVSAKNAGIAREWALCQHYGIERTKHDHTAYNVASDVDAGEKQISVKSSKFTLMNGKFCNGCEDFDGIWNIYKTNVHSNTFVYITLDFIAYEMNIEEFERFVYAFCFVDRDSQSNGGRCKIRCRSESKKMLAWLAENVA